MGARVLVVDDDPWILRMVTATLEKRSYVVDTAKEGRQALERAQSNPPDVIISDVMMPVMDGWTFVAHLKQHPRLRLIPVIFLTALQRDERRLAELGLGPEDFLAKPFRFDDLEKRVATALSRAQSPTPGQSGSYPGVEPGSYPGGASGSGTYPMAGATPHIEALPPDPGGYRQGHQRYPTPAPHQSPPPHHPHQTPAPYQPHQTPPPGYPPGPAQGYRPPGPPPGYPQQGQPPHGQPPQGYPPQGQPPPGQPPQGYPPQYPPQPSDGRGGAPAGGAPRDDFGDPADEPLQQPPRTSEMRAAGTGSFPAQRRTTALNGRLEQLQLSSLLVMMEMERKDGVLTLKSSETKEIGRIFLRRGQVICAKIDEKPDLAGRECAYEMLCWKAGTFSFNAMEVDMEDTVNSSTTHLLMEGARLIDEAERDSI